MKKLDAYEEEVLHAFEAGKLKSVASTLELAKFKAAARSSVEKEKNSFVQLVVPRTPRSKA
jgi:hypothetical protein